MEAKRGFLIAVILALFLIIGGVQATCEPGWKISYFKNQFWDGTPTVTYDSVNIHFADPTAPTYHSEIYAYSDIPNWPYGIIGRLQDYSLTADGYVSIPEEREYSFFTISDDGVQLFIDDLSTPVLSNTGDHGPTTDLAKVHLAPGLHHIVLKYRENLFAGTDPYHSAPNNVAVISLLWDEKLHGTPTYLAACHMTDMPVPEFPSAFLPAIFIIGMLGTVLLLRRIN